MKTAMIPGSGLVLALVRPWNDPFVPGWSRSATAALSQR